MRAAIVSTYPPRACGIGAFAADVRTTLLGVPDVERVDLVAVVHEPSSPQRRGLLATIAQAVRGDYVRTARMLGRLESTSCCSSTSTGSSAARTASTCSRLRATCPSRSW